MLSDVSLSPIEVVRSSVEFSDQSSDDEATLSSFLAAEEIKEDEPPETAVLGYRASDYEVEDFYAGVHLHYCVRKEDPWFEGLVVRARPAVGTVNIDIRQPCSFSKTSSIWLFLDKPSLRKFTCKKTIIIYDG